MKRWFLIFPAIALTCILPLFAQGKAPTIVFESQTKDFGKAVEGEVLKHVFKFTNKGNETLEIAKIEPG